MDFTNHRFTDTRAELRATNSNYFKPVSSSKAHLALSHIQPRKATVATLLSDYADLINPQYEAWYAKRFYALGRERVMQFASIARGDGRNPKHLFGHLIRGAA